MNPRSLRFTAALAALFAVPALADDVSEQAASELLHRRLEHERPQDAALLKSVKGKDIVVVAGEMDHIEQVLAAAGIPYTLIRPEQVADYKLRSSAALMVNCPGIMPDAGVKRIERFVRAGGLLYTTDWALQSILMKAFPGLVATTDQMTESEVVPVMVDKANDNLMSNLLLRKGSQPQWWLEGGSFPIRVLDPKRVEVLAHSEQMGKKYGSSPVVIHFRWDDGEVVHVVSHFYRQLETQGPRVAAAQALDSYSGLNDEDRRALKGHQEMNAAKAGDVESSYAFQQMTANLVTGKQKKNSELEKAYDMTVSGNVVMRSAPVASAPAVASEGACENRIKVLERKEGQARVRDDLGNEGWVPAEALIAR